MGNVLAAGADEAARATGATAALAAANYPPSVSILSLLVGLTRVL